MSFVSSAYQRICALQFHAEESHYRSETIDDTKLRVQKPNVLYWSKSDTKLTISKRQPDELITKVKAYASPTGSRTETRAELDEFCTQLCKTTAICSIRLAQFLIAGNSAIATAKNADNSDQIDSDKRNKFSAMMSTMKVKRHSKAEAVFFEQKSTNATKCFLSVVDGDSAVLKCAQGTSTQLA